METNNNKKQAARNLFLHSDRTRAEIADLIDINTKTLYLWIKHGRWEEMKLAARQTPANLLQDLYDHIGAVNNKIKEREDRCPTYQEVEMLRKLFASTKHIQRLNVGAYIEAFTELTSFINEYDHDLGKKVLSLTDKYIKGLINPLSPEAYKHVSDVNRNLDKAKEQEEKEIAELEQEETKEQEAKNSAVLIPLPVNVEDHPDAITPEPIVLPTPVPFIKILKSTPSFFVRPPLRHYFPALLYKVIGHHRAFFHYITHSKPNNNDNSMPDENLQGTGH